MTAKATARLKPNPVEGEPPGLDYVPLADLLIDTDYQRSVEAESSKSLIRRIAQFWHWGLCQPLAVSRRADGKLYVVDGQHRLRAAEMRGDIAALPCVIQSYPDAGSEAAAFVALNRIRRALNALDLYKAALAAEDHSAVHIKALVSAAGLSLAPHSNYLSWKPGMIGNIAGVQRSYRTDGAAVTAEALAVLRLAFPDEILRYCGTLYVGLVRIIADHREIYDRDLFVGALRAKTQSQWVKAGLSYESRMGVRRQVAIYRVMLLAFQRTLDRLNGIPEPEPEPVAAPAPVAAPVRAQTATPHPVMQDHEIAWCNQCDKRVSGFHVARCTDRHCALRPSLAA